MEVQLEDVAAGLIVLWIVVVIVWSVVTIWETTEPKGRKEKPRR